MKTLIHNKRATFDYEILERFEAGLELSGSEVKSLRLGHGSLDGAYILIRHGQAYVTNMFIPPYQVNNQQGYEPIHDRKLLLTKDEIRRLSSLEKGLTIVPTLVYNKGRWIKAEIAAVRGKKKFDKRESIKKRDVERQVRREYTDR